MSVESEVPALTLESLVLLDQDIELYVLTWPEDELDGEKDVKVLAVMRREDGVPACCARWISPSRSACPCQGGFRVRYAWSFMFSRCQVWCWTGAEQIPVAQAFRCW